MPDGSVRPLGGAVFRGSKKPSNCQGRLSGFAAKEKSRSERQGSSFSAPNTLLTRGVNTTLEPSGPEVHAPRSVEQRKLGGSRRGQAQGDPNTVSRPVTWPRFRRERARLEWRGGGGRGFGAPEALYLNGALRPDLIISTSELGGAGEGLALCKRLKASWTSQPALVLIFTARN